MYRNNPFIFVPPAQQLTVNITVSPTATLGLRNVSVANTPPGGGVSTLTNGFAIGNNPATSVSTSNLAGLPTAFVLEQNSPNPFNPSTTILYGLPHASSVQLTVFNTLGQMVAQLVNGEMNTGYHEVEFDAAGLSSGIYLYRMQAGDFVSTRTMLVVK